MNIWAEKTLNTGFILDYWLPYLLPITSELWVDQPNTTQQLRRYDILWSEKNKMFAMESNKDAVA